MNHFRRSAFIIMVVLAAVLLCGCGSSLTGRWTEYRSESYYCDDGQWIMESEWTMGDDDRSPSIAEFTGDGKFRIDGDECSYELEDSYLRLYQDGYLETDLCFFDSDRMVIQARYGDELKVIYFRKNRS